MQITENIVKLLNIKACTIFLLDKTQNKLDVSASHGLSDAYLRKGPLDADKSIAETLGGQMVLILDMSKDTSPVPGRSQKGRHCFITIGSNISKRPCNRRA